MKISALSCVLSLAVILPVTMVDEPAAYAQGADTIVEVARQRYADGVSLYKAGKFEDARAAFLQAYALKREPIILLNLGQSELRSGHPEDAGNHLQQFLHDATSATAQQKADAQQGIADAKKKSGYIIVLSDVIGAELSVDGKPIGKSPLLDPYFVNPGKRTIVATYQGKSSTVAVDAKIGSATAATVNVGAPPATTTPTAATTGPSAAATPTTSPASTPPSPTDPLAPTAPEPVAGEPTPALPVEPDDGSMSFGYWYTHRPLAWVGTAVTVGGLVTGIVGAASMGQARANTDTLSAAIASEARDRDAAKFDCTNTDSFATNPIPAWAQDACGQLRTATDDYDSGTVVTAIGWSVFGVGLVGTGLYAYFDYFSKDHVATPSDSAFAPKVRSITPAAGPGVAGLNIAGTF